MVILLILLAFALMFTIWILEKNASIAISLVKGLIFGAVFGSYSDDENEVSVSHYQIGIGFIILTLNWYNDYE